MEPIEEDLQSNIIQATNNVSNDPTEINPDLYPLLFQHLNGSDLLNLSQVSRQFYQVTAEQGEKKIQLVIQEGWSREFDMEIIKNTSRRYTNINIKQLLRTRDQVLSFISNAAEYLVSIETKYDFEMNNVILPSVKSLKIQVEQGEYFEQGLLSSVNNLEKLQISGSVTYPEKVITCLESNPNLKELTLEHSAAKVVFDSVLFHPFELQLKVLKINRADFNSRPKLFDRLNVDDRAQSNFTWLLNSQNDSIEELKLLSCDFRTLIKIFNGMPKLKRFTFSPLNESYFSLREHPGIEELNVILATENQLQNLLLSTPNLKKLYIAIPTPNMIQFMMRQCPNLREFRFAYFQRNLITVEKLKAWYEQEKTNSYRYINSNIEIISQI